MGGGNREPKVETNYRIRKLTPKECFRLQGVKDEDIILSVSDSQAYKIAGNAISVNVMQMILRQLYKPKPSGGLF
jgi:DNA (cytosine-5)-methyltransferase 1